MLFDDDQCFSPLSPSCDETLDDLLSPSSSKSNETSMFSDAGHLRHVAAASDDNDDDPDDVDVPKKKKIRPSRSKLNRPHSGEAATGKAKHPGSVGRRNERERNRVKQVSLNTARAQGELFQRVCLYALNCQILNHGLELVGKIALIAQLWSISCGNVAILAVPVCVCVCVCCRKSNI